MLDQMLVIVSVTLLVMVSPGPDMVLVLRNTFINGRRAGLQTSVGILSGNLVHVTYCLLGIGLLISRNIIAFSVLKYAAAVYLIYLGIMSLRSGKKTLDTDHLEGRARQPNMVRSGLRQQSPQPERRAVLSRRVYDGHNSQDLSEHHVAPRRRHAAGQRVVLGLPCLHAGSADDP